MGITLRFGLLFKIAFPNVSKICPIFCEVMDVFLKPIGLGVINQRYKLIVVFISFAGRLRSTTLAICSQRIALCSFNKRAQLKFKTWGS